jgi:hypothetical protein
VLVGVAVLGVQIGGSSGGEDCYFSLGAHVHLRGVSFRFGSLDLHGLRCLDSDFEVCS